MTTELSPTAQALVSAARRAATPGASDAARIHAALFARMAAGDVPDPLRAPPPNTAAAIARGALGKALSAMLLATLVGAGGARSASASSPVRPRVSMVTSSRLVAREMLPSVSSHAVSVRVPVRSAQTPGTIPPHAPAARPPSPQPAHTSSVSTPSDVMVNALGLYQHERYAEAAVQFQRIAEGTGEDTVATVQRAEFYLAKCFYQLHFHQSALGLLSEIAERGPSHPSFAEALPWLVQLATVLPEPSGAIRAIGHYDVAFANAFHDDENHATFDGILYLLGRARYEEARLDEAVALFQRVGDHSRWTVPARFFEGVSHVRLHHAQPAVAAFQRVQRNLDAGVPDLDDTERMRDLAWLELGRMFYATQHYASALASWSEIRQQSEYWLDSQFESAWARFLVGDHSRALGNVFTLNTPYFETAYYPESLVLRSVIYFSNCQYELAENSNAEFHQRFGALLPELEAYVTAHATSEENATLLHDVRDGGHHLSARMQPLVHNALGDRAVQRHLAALVQLDAESARLRAMPASFQESGAAQRVLMDLSVARSFAEDAAGDLVRQRFRRALDELRDLENQVTAVSIEILGAQRGDIGQEIGGQAGTTRRGDRVRVYAVGPMEDGAHWPFNGEFWEDEVGTYEQPIQSRCVR